MKYFGFFILLFNLTNAHSLTRGETLFKKAYKTENLSPEKSLAYYKAEMQAGLPSAMKKAARWKIYHLLVETGQYPTAYAYLQTFGKKSGIKSIREKLIKTVRLKWNLSEAVTGKYLSLLNLLKTDKETALQGLREIINEYPENFSLFSHTTQHCSAIYRNCGKDLIPENLETVPTSERLAYAAWSLSANYLMKSSQILDEINIEELKLRKNLTDYWFLRGKLNSKNLKHESAIESYKMAINHSENVQEKRNIRYLVSLEFYKAADFKEAKTQLPASYKKEDGPNAHLLRILVSLRLECNQKRLEKLSVLKDTLIRNNQSNISGILSEDSELFLSDGCKAVHILPQEENLPE